MRGRLAEQASLAGPEQDRLERLAGADDPGPVAGGQQVVQRAVLEVRREEAREPLGRQVDLLEQERLAAGDPQPLEVERRRARLDPERRRDDLAGRLGPGADQARLRVEAAVLHLLGEAERAGEVALDPRREDGRAAAAGPLDPALAGQLGERPPDGDQAAAVALGELALRREEIAGTPFAVVERRAQVQVDLVMQRDGTELESETGHRVGDLAGRSWDGLRGVARRAACATVQC